MSQTLARRAAHGSRHTQTFLNFHLNQTTPGPVFWADWALENDTDHRAK